MLNEDPAIVILITCSNKPEAMNITNTLVEQRLIACGNILSDVTSIFRWENRLSREEEILLIAKSRQSRFDQIVKEVQALHSYDTPEIIALPIVAGTDDYLNWLAEETKQEK